MASAGSALIDRLNSSSFEGLYDQYASFLLPLRHHPLYPSTPTAAAARGGVPTPRPTAAPKKRPNPRLKKDPDPEIRPLAKQFQKLLVETLNKLQVLCRPPKSSTPAAKGVDEAAARELLAVYALIVDCLLCISPELDRKPASILFYRGQIVRYFELWGLYDKAEEEAEVTLALLASIKGNAPAAGCVLPNMELVCAGDADATTLVLHVLVALAGCAYKGIKMDSAGYERILHIFKQVVPLLGTMDQKVSNKYHAELVNVFYKCAVFLTGKALDFDDNLVMDFCLTMVKECLESSHKDHFSSIARKVCSSAPLDWDRRPSLILGMLRITLDSIVHDSRVGMVRMVNDYLEFVSFCADSIVAVTMDIWKDASDLLYKQSAVLIQVSSPTASILIFYATGLFLSASRKSNDGPMIISLLDNGEMLQHLADSLGNLSRYFQIASHNESDSVIGLNVHLEFKKFQACDHLHWNASLISYLDGLEFLCKLLTEYINKDWKQLTCENGAVYNTVNIKHIQDTLLQFCYLILAATKCTEMPASDTQRIRESCGTLLEVVVSALKICFVTSGNYQECFPSIDCVKHVISSDWIEPRDIKYLISTLSNIGVTLYDIGHLDQAPIALKLCRKGIRKHIHLLLEIYSQKSNDSLGDEVTGKKFEDVITDAYRRSALILDIFHKCGAANVHKFAVKSLIELSTAEDTFQNFSSSLTLVKQWVKIMYKEFQNADAVDNASVLYCPTWSKKMAGKILEQELLAYEILEARNPKLCQKMRLKIMAILLKDVYTTQSYKTQRSWILVKKGRALRTCGLEGLESCMDCLSEAISCLSDLSGISQGNSPVYHQLALTHCVYAQCLQEANRDFEVILKYVELALNLWSKMGIQDLCSTDFSHLELGAENAVPLLCNIVDLLALKGNMKYHFDLCKLIFFFCKRGNIPPEKCLAMLWTGRKLNHSLCASPIDEDLFLSISEHLSIPINSVDFWINSIKDPSSILMFLQKLLPCDSILPEVSSDCSGRYFSSKISIDEVKNAASSLISDVPLTSKVAFIAGYLYYDLSERLFSLGRIFEALLYAREALRLRKKMLRRNFSYSIEQKNADLAVSCKLTQNNHDHFSLEAIGSIITEVWPDVSKPSNLEELVTSPWTVLRCYLDSTLQAAMLYESIGNGVEAESILLTGKRISHLHGLPLYEIAFTSLLGQLYRKKQLWDLAQSELDNARCLLDKNGNIISCKHCKLAFGVTIDMQLADISRSLFEKGLQETSAKSLSDIRGIYQLAFDKLNHNNKELVYSSGELKTSGTLIEKDHVGGAKHGDMDSRKLPSSATSPVCRICSYFDHSSNNHKVSQKLPDGENLLTSKIRGGGSYVDTGVGKKSRIASNCLRTEPLLNAVVKSGRTRSSNRSCHNSANVSCEVNNYHDRSSSHASFSDKPCVEKSEVKENNRSPGTRCNEECLWDRTNCWRCLLIKVSEAGTVKDILSLKWECYRRRILLKLLVRIGRCYGVPVGNHGEHTVHDVFQQSISLLFHRPLFYDSYPIIRDCRLVKLIEEENVKDNFSIERAMVLYNLSWLSLKDCVSPNTSRTCCDLSKVIYNVLPWLFRAFVLCRELPLLFQKVSKLLSSAFLLSTLCDHCVLPFCTNKSLSPNHWAAYFHQASVGTYLQWDYLSYVNDKTCNSSVSEHALGASKMDTLMKQSNFLRFAPEKPEELENVVTDFFQGLPAIPIVCISILGGDYATLLGDTLLLSSSFPSWMLLTRVNSRNQPIVMLLPCDFIIEEHDDSRNGKDIVQDNIGPIKDWSCPWSCTVVDHVAPSYKSLLEENFLSLSNLSPSPVDAQVDRLRWWSERTRLNNRLDWLLKSLEDSWLGSWSCLLLGAKPNTEHADALILKLKRNLSSQCKFELNNDLLKAVVTGAKSVADAEACISQILRYKGFFGWGSCCEKERFRASSSSCPEENASVTESARNLILEVIGDPAESVDRESVILVLDSDIQMLPWENIPTLRNQEVYRMPSVASISLTLKRSCLNNKHDDSVLPSVDPFDAYYLLNPGGDLSNTQAEFEQWFRDQKWVGKSGVVPTTEELVLALQNHDLFLYFGHGNGTQYIPGYEIQKLDHCAATLLMGCSSGSLSHKGCYAPRGAPLLYLLAGSPAIVANLWDVTDKDIDRFSKVMLQSWLLQEESCYRCCGGLVNELRSISIEGNSGLARNKRKTQRGNKLEEKGVGKCKHCGGERKRIASFMSEAREACKFPLLIGAAPVCYGVPTVIRKR